jgi:hypothetical protein
MLVLLLVGNAHPDWLGKQKPVSDLDEVDYHNLNNLLSDAKGFFTLPYVLAETSNLLGFGKRSTATIQLWQQMNLFMEQCEELPTNSRDLICDPSLVKIGLTDLAILLLVRNGSTVITEDFALFGRLSELQVPVNNIRHMRPL